MRNRKAFTLIELVTAVATLALMIGFAGVIFQHVVKGYRTSQANAEIMQKYVAITQQLHNDFTGLLADMPGRISWDDQEDTVLDPNTTNQVNLEDSRADSIIFFAAGDFQTTRAYDAGPGSDRIIRGNTALINYCIADDTPEDPRRKVLVRRQLVLTADTQLSGDPNVAETLDDLTGQGDVRYEALYSSLSDLAADPNAFAEDFNDLPARVEFNANEPQEIQNLLARGVYDFKIKYIGTDSSTGFDYEWQQGADGENLYFPGSIFNDIIAASDQPRLSAIKFTFRICDSRGIIEQYDHVDEEVKPGRLFTYIVPIKDQLTGSID